MFENNDIIIFKLTNECNQKCFYCFIDEEEKTSSKKMDVKLFFNIIDKIAYDIVKRIKNKIHIRSNNPYSIKKLIFQGGDIIDKYSINELRIMLAYIKRIFTSRDIEHTITIQTNASSITDEHIDLFTEYDISLGISFDGFGCNSLRNTKSDNFYRNIFMKLNANNIDYGIMCTVHTANIDLLKTAIEEQVEGGIIKAYEYTFLQPFNNKTKIIDTSLDIFNKVIRRQFEEYFISPDINKRKLTEIKIENDIKRAILDQITPLLRFTKKSGCDSDYCGTGSTIITIDSYGNILMCDRTHRFLNENIISKYDSPLAEINRLERMYEYYIKRSKMLEELECDICNARNICRYPCYFLLKSRESGNISDFNIMCNIYKPMALYFASNFGDIAELMMINEIYIEIPYPDIYIFQDKKHMLYKQKKIIPVIIKLEENNRYRYGLTFKRI